MLTHLEIKNYALIDDLALDFADGFTTITGETGAGKSIMLGALSLLCGARFETKAARKDGGKTVVEASFADIDAETLAAAAAIIDEPLQPTDTLILRREVTPQGRSRAFINDTPVNLQQLSEIGNRLIDIHSQHNNLMLSDPRHQLAIIDSVAADATLLNKYKEAFHRYVAMRQEIVKRKEAAAKAAENRDFILFRLENLDKLKPKKGEWEELSKTHDRLCDAGEINSRLTESSYLLSGSDTSVLNRLAEARELLKKINFSLFEESESGDDQPIMQRIESLYVELKDIAETISDYCSEIEADPATLERVDARMDALHEAVKRYKVPDAEALVDLHEEMRAQLRTIEGGDDDLHQIEHDCKLLGRELKTLADELTDIRSKAAAKFSEELTALARPLGLHNLRFSAMLTTGKLTADGQDRIEFLCSFNKNQDMQPLAKVASGGETARLMLCIKEITSGLMRQPTIIFDEIDTGVSGDIAERMGLMMRRMGEEMQVLAITHLPQVAARGEEHLRVYKSDTAEATRTHIEKLTPEGREREIAKMLAGADLSDEALANARVLLNP